MQQQVASLSAVQLAEQQHNQEARARRAAEAPPGELGLPFASDAGDDDVLSLREEFLTFKEVRRLRQGATLELAWLGTGVCKHSTHRIWVDQHSC